MRHDFSFVQNEGFTERDHRRIQLDAVLQQRAQRYLQTIDFSGVKNGEVSPSDFVEDVVVKSPSDISDAVRVALAVLLGLVVFNAGFATSEAHADREKSVADKLAEIDKEIAAMERDSNRNQDAFLNTMDSSIGRMDTDEQNKIIKILESFKENTNEKDLLKFAAKESHLLFEHSDKWVKSIWAEEIALEGVSLDGYWFFESIYKFKNEKWAKEVALKAAKESPYAVFKFLADYKDQKWVKEVLETAIQHAPDSIFNYALFVPSEDYAKELFVRAAEKDPQSAFRFYNNYKEKPFVKFVIATATNGNPKLALDKIKEIIDFNTIDTEQFVWVQTIIESAASDLPIYAIDLCTDLNDLWLQYYKDTAIKQRPAEVARNILHFKDREDYLEIMEKSHMLIPFEEAKIILDNADELLHRQFADDVVQRVAENDPVSMLKYKPGVESGTSQEEITRLLEVFVKADINEIQEFQHEVYYEDLLFKVADLIADEHPDYVLMYEAKFNELYRDKPYYKEKYKKAIHMAILKAPASLIEYYDLYKGRDDSEDLYISAANLLHPDDFRKYHDRFLEKPFYDELMDMVLAAHTCPCNPFAPGFIYYLYDLFKDRPDFPEFVKITFKNLGGYIDEARKMDDHLMVVDPNAYDKLKNYSKVVMGIPALFRGNKQAPKLVESMSQYFPDVVLNNVPSTIRSWWGRDIITRLAPKHRGLVIEKSEDFIHTKWGRNFIEGFAMLSRKFCREGSYDVDCPEFPQDYRQFKKALGSDQKSVLGYSSGLLRNTKRAVMDSVKLDPLTLEFAGKRLKAHEDVVMTAISKDGLALQFADEKFKKSPIFVMTAISSNGLALQFADDEFKKKPEYVMKAILRNGLALQFADDEFKDNEEFVMAAVSNDGLALQFASPRLQRKRNIVTVAVMENSLALQFADFNLTIDDELVKLVVSKDGMAIDHAFYSYKADKVMMARAVDNDPLSLKHGNLAIKKDFDIALQAVGGNGSTLPIVHPILTVPNDYLLLAAVKGGFRNFAIDDPARAKAWAQFARNPEIFATIFNLSNTDGVQPFLDELEALNIDYYQRFNTLSDLMEIAYNRQNLDAEDDRPVAVLHFTKWDYNGFLGSNQISELIKQGYRVLYYEPELEGNLYNAQIEASINTLAGAELLIFGAHGTNKLMAYGPLKDTVFKEKDVIHNEEKTIDLTDEKDLRKLRRTMKKGSVIILESCSTGYKKSRKMNVANMLARSFPGSVVFAPTLPSSVKRYEYDKKGRVAKVVYSGGDYNHQVESYKAKAGSGILGLEGEKKTDDQILSDQIQDLMSQLQGEQEPNAAVNSDENNNL